MMLFMVTTTEGLRAADGVGNGMTEDAATSDARVRNRSAEQLGIQTRYEVAPFIDLRKTAA